MMSDHQPEAPAREEQIQRLVKQYETELRKKLKSGVRPLHEIEQEVEEIGEAAKQAIIGDVTKELGAGYIGTRAACSCGARAKYCGSPRRQVITRHGVVSIRRAYYYCRSCRFGLCPLDFELELGAGACSRTVQSLLARFSSHMSFELAARELEAVCGIRLSATTVQTYSKKIGERIATEWNGAIAKAQASRLQPSGLRVKRLYVSMDGVMAHIGGEWREVKLGATYQRSSSGRACQTRYYASLEQSHAFGPKIRALAHLSGADSCHDIAMVADGAPWIWQETGKHFPRCIQVLDYYHATEHLTALAEARFGANTTEAKLWMKQQKERFHADGVGEVIRDIQAWKPRKEAKRKIKRTTIQYFEEHRHRMLYETLSAGGYYIGSGIIEAGAKTVVKARMGAAGMRWEEKGAVAIMHMSATWKSAGHETFFKYTQ